MSMLMSDSLVTSTRLSILHEFSEAYNRHDVDEVMEFMATDCSFISYFGTKSFGEKFVGKENVRQRIASFLHDFPDARWDNAHHMVDGDHGVSHWTYTGTRRGTNDTVSRNGCDLFTFRGDKILVKDTYQKWVQPLKKCQSIQVPDIHEPVGRYAHAVKYNDLVFVSGSGPFDMNGELSGKGDIVAQTTKTMQNIQAILEASGLTFANVIKETIFLTDINDRVATRAVRERFYGSNLPACTLIEIGQCVHPDMKIEIEIVAGV